MNSIKKIYVPIIVDEVNKEFVRATYFIIENNHIGDQWYLNTKNNIRIPFLMLGLRGIILGSNKFEKDNLFINSDDFENMFLDIEENNLSINVDSLIIPIKILEKAYRGAFFRIPQELFQLLLKYNDNWDKQVFDDYLYYVDEILHLEKEEVAFKMWCKKILIMEKHY